MRKVHLILVIGMILILTACGGGGDALNGTAWYLVSLDGSSPIEETSATITIFFENGEVSGSSGCNSYGGGYGLSGEDAISVNQIAATLMACADSDMMDQEQVYIEILGDAEGWEIDEGQLFIYDTAGRTLLFDLMGE